MLFKVDAGAALIKFVFISSVLKDNLTFFSPGISKNNLIFSVSCSIWNVMCFLFNKNQIKYYEFKKV